MVMEIPFNFQICVQCAEKAISKIASISHEILSKFDFCGTSEYQKMTSKSSKTMGSEWPDKHIKAGFGNMASGGEFFLRGHPPQLNMYLTVLAVGWSE